MYSLDLTQYYNSCRDTVPQVFIHPECPHEQRSHRDPFLCWQDRQFCYRGSNNYLEQGEREITFGFDRKWSLWQRKVKNCVQSGSLHDFAITKMLMSIARWSWMDCHMLRSAAIQSVAAGCQSLRIVMNSWRRGSLSDAVNFSSRISSRPVKTRKLIYLVCPFNCIVRWLWSMK